MAFCSLAKKSLAAFFLARARRDFFGGFFAFLGLHDASLRFMCGDSYYLYSRIGRGARKGGGGCAAESVAVGLSAVANLRQCHAFTTNSAPSLCQSLCETFGVLIGVSIRPNLIHPAFRNLVERLDLCDRIDQLN
jgi:hypothetical protein